MKQRIIAAALAVLLVALSFSACGKKKTIITKNGQEYEVVTDENGEFVTGLDGDVAVYSKDENGKYQKDENGDKLKVYVDFPRAVADSSSYETPYFKLTMPEGWKAEKDVEGSFLKADNEKIQISVDEASTLNEEYTMDRYVSIQTGAVDSLNALENSPAKISYEVKERTPITDENRRCIEIAMTVQGENGTTIAEQHLFYVYNETVMLRFSFVCQDETQVGTLDGYSFLQENVSFKALPREDTTK